MPRVARKAPTSAEDGFMWTRTDSYNLDLYTTYSRDPHASPLRPDPKLWEVFAEDREQHPWDRIDVTEHNGRMFPLCNSCNKPMRHRDAKAATAPGTVRHSVDAYCESCMRTSDRHIIDDVTSFLGLDNAPEFKRVARPPADRERQRKLKAESARRSRLKRKADKFKQSAA